MNPNQLLTHFDRLTLCDRLEMQLTTAQAVRRRLLESVLHEALAFPRV